MTKIFLNINQCEAKRTHKLVLLEYKMQPKFCCTDAITDDNHNTHYNLFTWRRASKDYKRSLQRQVEVEVFKKRARKSEN